MKRLLLVLSLFLLVDQAAAEQMTCHHSAANAPIGVMGEHTHKAGVWMVSYRYERMEMDGNRDGANRLSENEVLKDFPVAPEQMTMDMHMFELMYAPSDKVTLMAMVPYSALSMDHITRSGTRFTTESAGIGDTRLTALYPFYGTGRHRLHFNAGISVPTGSIHQRDDTPAGSDRKLPYPMQLGSGTFDLLPGITYRGMGHLWSWGAQALGTIRIGRNDNDYSLGNRLEMTGWAVRRWSHALSGSVRLAGQSWGNIRGSDSDLNPLAAPTADPRRRGGSRIDLLLGLSFSPAVGGLKGHRLAIEVGAPLYQSLDGPQLETDWRITVGWQYVL